MSFIRRCLDCAAGLGRNLQLAARHSLVFLPNDLVYERLAPDLLIELEERNPKDEKGHRKHRHHQWPTEDIGHPKLAQHLYAVIGLMRASLGRGSTFYRMMQRAFPKKKYNDALTDGRYQHRRIIKSGRRPVSWPT